MGTEDKSNKERIEGLEQRIEALENKLKEVRKEANQHTPPVRYG